VCRGELAASARLEHCPITLTGSWAGLIRMFPARLVCRPAQADAWAGVRAMASRCEPTSGACATGRIPALQW